MSDKNDNKIARNRMYFDFADFGQGNFNKKNVGIKGQFTDVTNCDFPSVNKPSFGKDYGPKTSSTHNYNATVNQCAVDGSNQFFMKMRLKPYKIYGDGTKGTKSQKGETYDFLTSKCGTNDKIEFSITPAPASALTTVIPQAKADPSKGSKAPNPSKGSKAPKPSKGPKASSVSNEPSLSPTKSLLPSDVPSVSNEPSLSPTIKCVRTFAELLDAIINGNDDIKLCSGEIICTKQIKLTKGGRKTFTCPDGDCKLNADSNSRFFLIKEDVINISFDGIIFKNGNSGGDVSPQ